MNPEQQVSPQPNAPIQPAAYSPEQIEALKRSNKNKLVWGLILLVGPTALIIISILVYAVANFMFSSTVTPSDTSSSLFADEGPNVATTITNVLLFLVGAISILTWLPGIIGGIILLTSRKQV